MLTMIKQISNGVKLFISTISFWLLSAPWAFAHEEGTEITNVAEADWLGPLVAVAVITAVIIIARIIKRSGKL
jgi:hypothetical protein